MPTTLSTNSTTDTEINYACLKKLGKDNIYISESNSKVTVKKDATGHLIGSTEDYKDAYICHCFGKELVCD